MFLAIDDEFSVAEKVLSDESVIDWIVRHYRDFHIRLAYRSKLYRVDLVDVAHATTADTFYSAVTNLGPARSACDIAREEHSMSTSIEVHRNGHVVDAHCHEQVSAGILERNIDRVVGNVIGSGARFCKIDPAGGIVDVVAQGAKKVLTEKRVFIKFILDVNGD